MLFDGLSEAYKEYCQEAHNAINKFAEELNKANGRTDVVYLLVDFLYIFLPNKSDCKEVRGSSTSPENELVLSESLVFPGISVKFAPHSVRSLCLHERLGIGQPIKNKAAQDIIQAYINLEKNSMGGCRGLTPVGAEAVREALLEYAINKAVRAI